MSGIIYNSFGSLTNGVLINGVANFYQPTKPTTRVDGSALVAGDLWYNSTTRLKWFWNGTYWLSEQSLKAETSFVFLNASSSPFLCGMQQLTNGNTSVFVERIHATVLTLGANDASNYWTLDFNIVDIFGAFSFSLGILNNANTDGAPTFLNSAVNTACINSNNRMFRITISKVLLPTQLYGAAAFYYREIAP